MPRLNLNTSILTALIIVPLIAVCLLASAQKVASVSPERDHTNVDEAWSTVWDDHPHPGEGVLFTPPRDVDIPEGEFGELVRDGMQAFMYPSVYARNYVGNELACSNCHLDAGRCAGAAPMWGAYPVYPKYRGKNKQVNTMEMRVQGCFRYSMDGTPPEADSELMKSYLAYFSWLSQGAPVGAKLAGAGFYSLPDPQEEPDFFRGEAVYRNWCAVCHSDDGGGLHHTEMAGWIFPPLWGPQSFNWGAGMHQPDKAAAFIKRNMPFGLQNVLTDQQAWDVAIYINSHERPQDPRYNGDVDETRAAFHTSKYNTYGMTIDGNLLGENSY